MKKQISIIASAAVLTTAAFADSNSIDDAFKNGSVSGDFSAHYQSSEEGNADSGFSVGTAGLNYSTDSFNGISLNTGFRASHVFTEENDGDADGDIATNAVMNVFNVQYSNDMVDVVVGRQEIDLEWLGDYNEAAVVAVKAIPNTTLVAGYTKRQAVAGNDEITEFNKVGTEGAYVVDAKVEAIKGLVVNPYFYSIEDAADFYGLKVDFDTDAFGVTGHYAKSSEDAGQDGKITHVEARTAVSGLSLAAGYIKAGDDNGVGSMDAAGDNIDPTEELGAYDAGSKTLYATAGYEVSGVELSALYAQADRANDDKDKEITVGAAYGITDSLSAEVLYTDVSKDSADDLSKLVINMAYEF